MQSKPNFLLLMLLLFCGLQGLSQTVQVPGLVLSKSGEPLQGASIRIVDVQTNATANLLTDANGAFSFAMKDGRAYNLYFSFVGYNPDSLISFSVGANERSSILMRLAAVDGQLDEVVVVGYGTQKRVNLTGAVGSVSGSELLKRPAPNVTNLLQGRLAGLDVRQNSGQPGLGTSDIVVRGRGTFTGSSAPLILVDGVAVTSLNNVAPEDVADVTVLKDAASASIYGSRAANGVILVTTKKGRKGQSVIEYSTSIGTSQATILPDLIYDSPTYMQMFNDARQRRGEAVIYTQEQIDAYKNSTDQTKYPDFNWIDFAFKKATIQNHHLGFSGGSEKTTYNLSLNYLSQDGILPGNDYKRYNVLIDLSTKVHDRVTVGGTINMSYEDIIQPWLSNDNLVLLIYHGSPTYSPYLPDGSGRIAVGAYRSEGLGQRSFTSVVSNSGQSYKNYRINAQLFANVDLAKGLQWQTKGAIAYYDGEYRNRQHEVPQYIFQPNANGEYEFFDNSGTNFLGLNQQMEKDVTKTLYSTLTYETSFAQNHNLKALGGYEQVNNRSPFLTGMRTGFPNSVLSEINAGSPQNQSTSGNTIEWALQSFFGRINYDYKGKYLLEGNIRYDGSSRIAPENRWNLYNGVSAGWRVSQEEFMKNMTSLFSDLKLRASLGTLGNQEIQNIPNGNYAFQDILATTTYPFDGKLSTGALKTRLIDPTLQWENTKITNLGLDVAIKRGLFSASIDWYKKQTSGILTQRLDVPASIGLSAPVSNIGSMENTGWELDLGHQNNIGEFSYGVNVIFSTYKNKVTKVLARQIGSIGGSAGGPNVLTDVGLPYQSFYIYEWVGIFQNQSEIDAWAKQPNSGTLKPGDLKIADRDGNGTVGPEDRMTISPFPKYTYSFGFNANWKGLTLTAFFQGVEGQKMFLKGWGVDPFLQNAPPPAKFLNAWTPENPSNTVPAVYLSWDYPGVAGYPSTYYLNDLSYLRLKNLYLGYTVPKHITDKIKSKGLVIYVSGDNLLTFTKFEGADPERRVDNTRYATFPQARILTAGLNIKF